MKEDWSHQENKNFDLKFSFLFQQQTVIFEFQAKRSLIKFWKMKFKISIFK